MTLQLVDQKILEEILLSPSNEVKENRFSLEGEAEASSCSPGNCMPGRCKT